jgi:hypothetical protein
VRVELSRPRWHVNSLELRPIGTWEVCLHCGQLQQRGAFRGCMAKAALHAIAEVHRSCGTLARCAGEELPPSVRAPVTLSRVRQETQGRTRRLLGRGRAAYSSAANITGLGGRSRCEVGEIACPHWVAVLSPAFLVHGGSQTARGDKDRRVCACCGFAVSQCSLAGLPLQR